MRSSLFFTFMIGAFIGAFAQFQVSGEPEVIRDTVRVETEPAAPQVSSRAANWMARAIYSETKNEADYEYIGWVIRNRMESPSYPGTAREVVLDPSQFSAFNSWERRKELRQMSFPETKKTEFRRAYRMAQYILSSPDSLNPLPRVTHFFMHETMKKKYGVAQPDWAASGNLAWATQQTRYYRDVRPLP